MCCICWLAVSSAYDLDCGVDLRKTLSLRPAASPAERKSNLHTLHCRGSSCSCLLMDWGPEGLNLSVMLALVLQLNPGVRCVCFSLSCVIHQIFQYALQKIIFCIFINSIFFSSCFPWKTYEHHSVCGKQSLFLQFCLVSHAENAHITFSSRCVLWK